jgi:hypothetical protein
MNNNERELKWLLEKCQVDGGLNLADRQRYMELSGQLGITTDKAKRIYEDLSLANLHAAQNEQRARISSAAKTTTEADLAEAVKLANEAIGRDRAERGMSFSSTPDKEAKAPGVPGMDQATADYLEALNKERGAGMDITGRN